MPKTEQDTESLILGNRIRKVRLERGLSQGELGKSLAEQIGRNRPFSQAAISDLERGKKRDVVAISPETLATTLGVPIE